MANRGRRGGAKFAATPQGVSQALGFFSGVDSTVERVEAWDIKTQQFVDAILGLLGSGYSVGLYTHWSGEQIVLRIYQGDGRDDHLVRDAMELDSLVAAILKKLNGERVEAAE